MMATEMNILVFGQLEEITGSSVVAVKNVTDTELLLQKLYAQYPLLKEKKFLISLNKKIVTERTPIGELAEIALLPPFSGG